MKLFLTVDGREIGLEATTNLVVCGTARYQKIELGRNGSR